MYKILLNEQWCKKCYICASVCKKEAIRREGSELILCPDRCVGCMACAHHCPEIAICIEKGGE